MAVHVLRRGVGHDVGAPFKGSAVDGCGEGVVYDQRNAVSVGRISELLNVEYDQRRIGDGFAEHRLCIRPKSSLQLFRGAVGVDKGEIHAHSAHSHVEEVECSPVDCG